MKRPSLIAGLAWLAGPLVAAACTDDVVVLQRSTSGSGGASSGESTSAVVTVSSGEGGAVGTGAGPLPPVLECSAVEQDICLCESGATCTCGGATACSMACNDVECTLDCVDGAFCDVMGGVMSSGTCSGFSQCNWFCQGNCFVTCVDGAVCGVFPGSGIVDMYCDESAICVCEPGTNCNCVGPGCPG